MEKSRNYVPGLDMLRFIAALWVACSHGARLPLDKLIPNSIIPNLNNAAFNGVAAVMLFFIISGFVIHLPNAETNRVNIRTHLIRRIVRISIPLVGALALGLLLGNKPNNLMSAVGWSIFCEIFYYASYPLLLIGFRKYGILQVLIAASIISFALILFNRTTLYWWEYDIFTCAIVGLPCWLLGCLLATKPAIISDVTLKRIWVWRISALLLSIALKFPVMHGPLRVGYPESHWLFALFAFFWLQQEISFYSRHRPLPILESAGKWSYSIYLIHGLVLTEFEKTSFQPALIYWAMQLAAILIFSYTFYQLVEKPSHILARRLSNGSAAAS